MNNEKHSPIEPELKTNNCWCEVNNLSRVQKSNCLDWSIANGCLRNKAIEPDTPLQPVKDEGWKEKFEYWLTNNMYINHKTATLIIDHVERYIRPEPSSKREYDSNILNHEHIFYDAIDEIESCYPTTVFKKGGTSQDAMSAEMARVTCNNIRKTYLQMKHEYYDNNNVEPSSKEQEGDAVGQSELWKEVVEIENNYIVDFEVSRYKTDYRLGGKVIDELMQKFTIKKKP